jgi:hypothetical protein
MNNSNHQRCFLSEKGHNNFWYPTTTAALVIQGCNFESLNWVGGATRKLKAIKVLKSCVLPLEFNQSGYENLSPPHRNSYTIVWVEK